MSTYSFGAFPPKENLETVNVLQALVTARHLAELKGATLAFDDFPAR